MSKFGFYAIFDLFGYIPSPLKGKDYDKEKNPEGIIRMVTAENSLLTNELLEVRLVHFAD